MVAHPTENASQAASEFNAFSGSPPRQAEIPAKLAEEVFNSDESVDSAASPFVERRILLNASSLWFCRPDRLRKLLWPAPCEGFVEPDRGAGAFKLAGRVRIFGLQFYAL
jgi:hypothetical protein